MNYDFSKINTYYDDYLARVEKDALSFQVEVLNPWLAKRKLSFVSGMGTWHVYISRLETPIYLDDIKGFKWLYDILDTTIPGTNNCFGEFMSDYNHKR
jgi:hypothetical protein